MTHIPAALFAIPGLLVALIYYLRGARRWGWGWPWETIRRQYVKRG